MNYDVSTLVIDKIENSSNSTYESRELSSNGTKL